MKKMEQLSENIKFLRKKYKKTQKDVADFLGQTTTNISYYESGETTPPISVLLELAKYFEVSTDDLIYKDLSQNQTYSAENENMNTTSEPPAAYKTKKRKGREAESDWQEKLAELENRIKILEKMLADKL